MRRPDGSSKIKGKGIGAATIFCCLIAFLIVLTLLESNSRASAIFNLQLSFNTYEPLSTVAGAGNHLQQGKESSAVSISPEEKQNSENSSSGNDGEFNLPVRMTEDLSLNEETTVKESKQPFLPNNENLNSSYLKSDSDEEPNLPDVSSEDTTQNEEVVGKKSSVASISSEENQNSENSSSGNDGEFNLPVRMTEDLSLNEETTVKESKRPFLPNNENLNSSYLKSDSDKEPNLPDVSSEDTTQNEEAVVKETNKLHIPAEEKLNSINPSHDDGGEMMLPTKLTEELSQDETTESSETESDKEQNSEDTIPQADDAEKQKEEIKPDKDDSNKNQKSKLVCDFTHPRADTCVMEGDVRVLGTYSTVFFVSPMVQDTTESKIRPYARKWEKPTMQMIREVNVKQALPDQAPPCTVRHDVPVVVFSTGGFVGNVFHDYTDILIPLFLAANQYAGKVQFAVTDMSWWWIFKYLPMMKTLSPYPVLNLDQDHNVHCFPSAQVGLKSHKPLGIDVAQSPNGYTMQDFRAFIRKSFSLKRSSTSRVSLKSGKRPRLLILLRRGTRTLVNEKALTAMAKKIGFRVVTADPDKTREFPKFAHVVNSVDVMLGVHGAGLANMLYLPTNATVIQILPWGNLGFVGRHDYGYPLPDMGLRYVEHEIKEDESTLIHRYPRDHAVFTNPQAIHDQGWNTMYRIFLTEQNIMLNLDRFKGVLIDVFKSYVE